MKEDLEKPRKGLWNSDYLKSPGALQSQIPLQIFSVAPWWLLNQVTAIYPTCIHLLIVALIISWCLLHHLQLPFFLCPQVLESGIQSKTFRWLYGSIS